MRLSVIQHVLGRAMADSDFRAALFSDPDQALGEYDLTDEEGNHFRSYTPERLHAFVGQMVIHQLTAVRASRRVVVVPGWMDSPLETGDIAIRLGDEIVFGNGAHQSTRLCLLACEDLLHPGDAVLDLGTGTGILAIAAARLGAGSVLALDNDPAAVQAAEQNILINEVSNRVTARVGSVPAALKARPGGFDLVLANLLPPVLVGLLKDGLSRAVSPHGHLVLSGMRLAEAPPVAHILPERGLQLIKTTQLGEWAAFITRTQA